MLPNIWANYPIWPCIVCLRQIIMGFCVLAHFTENLSNKSERKQKRKTRGSWKLGLGTQFLLTPTSPDCTLFLGQCAVPYRAGPRKHALGVKLVGTMMFWWGQTHTQSQAQAACQFLSYLNSTFRYMKFIQEKYGASDEIYRYKLEQCLKYFLEDSQHNQKKELVQLWIIYVICQACLP